MSSSPDNLLRLLESKFGTDVKRVVQGNPSRVDVKPQSIFRICRFLLSDPTSRFDFLECIVGNDKGDGVQVTYILYSVAMNHRIALSMDLPKAKLEMESVTTLWPGARFFEMELREFLGIEITNLSDDEGRAFLLPMNWSGYPLRKDYKGGPSV